MSLKKNLLLVFASASIGAIATLASNYFISASWALPTQQATPSGLKQAMNCPMQSSRSMPRGMGGMGMMESMQVQSEFDYLTKMIPHHQEAIATAKLLKAGTNRPEMKKFADDIIRVQTAEINQMQTWLKRWYPNQKTQVAYMPMMRDLNNLKGNDLDQAFLEDMQMHHKGAIMMSHRLLMANLGKHKEVNTLAQQISTAQRNEIHQMQSWLQTWFGATGMMGNSRNHGFGMGMMHNMN